MPISGNQAQHWAPRASWWVSAVPTVSALAIALFVAQSTDPVTVLGSVLMLAAAEVSVGAVLGFLFGVPKALGGADTRLDSSPSGSAGPTRRPRYTPNTNLEQISDWLTKILVGVGLTQFGALRKEATSLIGNIAPVLGGGKDAEVFAATTLIYFTLSGFVGGWLLTRLMLTRALSSADEALDAFVEAEALELAGAPESAQARRDEALRMLSEADQLPRGYEELRRYYPPGRARTQDMQSIMVAARRAATSGEWTEERVRELFDTGRDGDRIFSLGLMQGNRNLADIDRVISAIARSRSAFEQYHALVTAYGIADALNAEERRQLRSAVESEMNDGGRIDATTERRPVAERLLDLLGLDEDASASS